MRGLINGGRGAPFALPDADIDDQLFEVEIRFDEGATSRFRLLHWCGRLLHVIGAILRLPLFLPGLLSINRQAYQYRVAA